MKRTLKQLAEWLEVTTVTMPETVVTGVSIDTRTITTGDLFVPFRGENANGHRFVQQAIDNGASAALWQLDEPNPPQHIPLILVEDTEIALQQLARAYRKVHAAKFIGITGSNGKTSSKDIVASMLAPFFKVQKTQGNFNNQLGLPITVLNLAEDTEIAVLEMGMSGFREIAFLTELAQPHIAIITNIGEAHMQDLGSRAGIAKAKFEITEGLAEDGVLFYDGDEPLLRELVVQNPQLKTQSFGLQQANDLYADTITTNEKGSTFTTHGALNGSFFISVLGEHQVKNTLGAMLIGKALTLTDEQIRTALQQVVLTDMRMQLVTAESGVLFINDAYNAAPTSVRAAIQFMQATTMRPKKWLVLGDMLELGTEELAFHAELADTIEAQQFTQICLFGTRMQALYDALTQQGAKNIMHTENDMQSIAKLIAEQADADTLILLKGSRGMKLEQLL